MTHLRILSAVVALPLAACTVQSAGPAYRGPSPRSGAPAPTGHAAPATAVACYEEQPGDAPSLLDQAVPLTTGTFGGCLAEGDDDGDVYVFSAPTTAPVSLVEVTLRSPDDRTHSCLHLYDGDREEIEKDCSYGKGGDRHLWFTLAAGTHAYVRAAKSKSYKKEWAAYEMSTSIVPINDADEPNEDRGAAKPLVLGTPRFGLLAPGLNRDKERDVYAIELPAGAVEIVVDLLTPDMRIKTALLSADGNQIGTDFTTTGGATGRLEAKVRKPGTYYVTVEDRNQKDNRSGKGEVPTSLRTPYSIVVLGK